MFIKFQFTANTRLSVPLRILTDVINTQSITSVSALQSRFTNSSYHSTLTTNFDAANSQIVRTVTASNTKAHFAYPTENPQNGSWKFTIEQQVYDSPTNYTYYQIRDTGGGVFTENFALGTLITGGTMASSQTALTVAENASTTSGTNLTVGGDTVSSTAAFLDSNQTLNIRTFWAYVTDKCFFWCAALASTFSTGFPSTFSTTTYCGPFFYSQYTRYDYHNLMSNNITPVLLYSNRGAAVGFLNAADINSIRNLLYTGDTTTLPLRVHSMISALPAVNSSWPIQFGNYVNLTIAGRSCYQSALDRLVTTVTTGGGTSTAGAVSTAASTRYPTSNLTGTGFGLLPFGWEAHVYANHGGNATDQCGVYIYNGDYAPGDTLVSNSKTYMIWPGYGGFSNRIGLAVPME